MVSARDLIMGSSSPAFSFARPGDQVVGQIITEPQATQQRDFATGQPAFWPSGDPKMQTVFQIQTQLRNYEGIGNPDRTKPDNGIRTIFIKGKHFEKATKEAILRAGGDFLDVGGYFQAIYTGDDMSSKAGNKPKLFQVQYQPPLANSGPANQYVQQGAPAHQGYGGQQYAQQAYPAQPAQPAPTWQQPGWQPQNGIPAVPNGFGTPGTHGAPPFPPQAPQAAAVPSHHGSPAAMPDWAAPVSTPPVPTSAPPHLSTLDLIRNSQSGPDPSGSEQVEPVF